jgi:hypothetical protein
MSQLQSAGAARRDQHDHEHERPYRRAHLASEAVVARYLNDISERRRGERPVRRVRERRLGLDAAAC